MADGKRLILVVDDEPRYVWAIRHNLEARGYRVISAGDGLEAVDVAAAKARTWSSWTSGCPGSTAPGLPAHPPVLHGAGHHADRFGRRRR